MLRLGKQKYKRKARRMFYNEKHTSNVGFYSLRIVRFNAAGSCKCFIVIDEAKQTSRIILDRGVFRVKMLFRLRTDFVRSRKNHSA